MPACLPALLPEEHAPDPPARQPHNTAPTGLKSDKVDGGRCCCRLRAAGASSARVRKRETQRDHTDKQTSRLLWIDLTSEHASTFALQSPVLHRFRRWPQNDHLQAAALVRPRPPRTHSCCGPSNPYSPVFFNPDTRTHARVHTHSHRTARQQFTDRGSVQVLIDKATGALQASSSSEKDGGVSLSGAELATVEASSRDAQGGWYRVRAFGGSEEAGAMTSVPMVRWARWPGWPDWLRETMTMTMMMVRLRRNGPRITSNDPRAHARPHYPSRPTVRRGARRIPGEPDTDARRPERSSDQVGRSVQTTGHTTTNRKGTDWSAPAHVPHKTIHMNDNPSPLSLCVL